MNTLLIIAVIVLIVVAVAMAVVLRFDRKQNKIVDAKLISEVEKNGALEQKITELNKAAHAAELRIALLEAENNNLHKKATEDKAELEKLQSSFHAPSERTCFNTML